MVNSQKRLTSHQAALRIQQFGPNVLPEGKGVPLWLRFLQQFNSPLIYILLFALVFDLFAWGYESFAGFPVESVTILVILLLYAFLGLWQEAKSEDALSRLKTMAVPQSWVYRDGSLVRIPVDGIVPGDLVWVQILFVLSVAATSIIWPMLTAMRELCDWSEAAPGIHHSVAVNVSSTVLEDPELPQVVQSAISILGGRSAAAHPGNY